MGLKDHLSQIHRKAFNNSNANSNMHKKANLNSTQDIEYWGTGVIKTKEAQFCAFSKWIKENV